MPTHCHTKVAVLLLMVALNANLAVQAAPVSYTLDPSQSSLTFSGNFAGSPFSAQKLRSLSATYSGTLIGELTGGVLSLSGGNSMVAAISPDGPFQPTTGSTGTDVYGAKFSHPSLGTVTIAYSGMTFDLLSGTIQNGVVPTGNAGFVGPSAFRDSLGESGNLAGGSFPNQTNLAASLTVNGNIETVVIPVLLTDSLNLTTASFTGQIVATRLIPEPSTWLLLATAAGALWPLRCRSDRWQRAWCRKNITVLGP